MSRAASFGHYPVASPPAPILKLVILGDGNVGKSSLMTRYVSNEFDPRCAHTVGVEFLRKEISMPNGERVSLQIWDTAGQERFRSLQRPFYRGTDICLLVFSVDDKNSLESLDSWIREFQRYAEVDVARFPFVIIGNKVDVEDEDRQVSASEAKEFCQRLQQTLSSSSGSSTSAGILPYPYFETSAKSGFNVEEAFTMAVSYMKDLRSSASQTPSFSASGSFKLESVNLRNAAKKKAKLCC